MTSLYYDTLLDTATSPRVIAEAVAVTTGGRAGCRLLRRHHWLTLMRQWEGGHTVLHQVDCSVCGEVRTLYRQADVPKKKESS